MAMPGRKYSAGSGYRYGFNGKENDKEVAGTTTYDYGFRIYNPALGKFLSVDPLTYSYPYYTPYQFAGNMPIAAIDLDGLEQYVVIYYKDHHRKTTEIQVRAIFDNKGKELNQHVHKAGEEVDIAKGNVLVFESYQEKNGYENLKVVDKRNIPDSKLTTQELKIFKKRKLEKEINEKQSLGYGGNPKGDPNQYISQDFVNADTKTYLASFIIPPPSPIPFQDQVLTPNMTKEFNAFPTAGDASTPFPDAVKMADEFGKSLQNTGITSVTITPAIFDASGGEGVKVIQSNGKTMIENVNEQYKELKKIIEKGAGGKVNVKVNDPKINTTLYSGKKMNIQTQ